MTQKRTTTRRRRAPKAQPLPDTLDLTAASDLKAFCLDQVATAGDVAIDISPVEVITTPCVQVLLALEKSLAADGRALRVVGESAGMERAFADLGLSENYRSWSQ